MHISQNGKLNQLKFNQEIIQESRIDLYDQLYLVGLVRIVYCHSKIITLNRDEGSILKCTTYELNPIINAHYLSI